MAAKRVKRSKTTKRAAQTRGRREGWFQSLGAMRFGLLALTVAVMAMSPRPGTPIALDGMAVLSTLVAPALAPIVFMVLMLDLLMGRVFMSASTGPERERYRRIVVVNLTAGVLLFLWWTPYFVRLVRP